MKKARLIIACIMVFGLLLTFQSATAADKAAAPEVKTKVDVKKDADVKKADPAKDKDAAAKAMFHGNTKTKTYHAKSCKDFDCKNCTENFATKEAAEKAGYKPHKDCVK